MGKAIRELGEGFHWECLFVHREKGLFLSLYVDDVKLAGKKQKIDPMWKVLMKEVDVGEPTSLTIFIWFALNENAKRAKILWTITEMCLNPESLQQQKKNYFVQGNLAQTSLHGPMIWKVMQRNVWSDTASWRTKQPSNCTKLQLHALMTINSKKKNWDLLENCPTYASQIVPKCLYLARIGRPDIPWSGNKLARAVTKWTRACDKRLARLISYTHHTSEFKQCCYVGNTAQQCRLGLFQDSDFAGDLEDSKSTSGGILCTFGSHTFRSHKFDV